MTIAVSLGHAPRALLAAALLLLSVPARGTTLVVNTTADELNGDGDCSLREAVQAANTNAAVDACPAGSPGADTIVTQASGPGVTIVLTLGELVLTEAVTLDGGPAPGVGVRAGGAGRLFRVAGGVGPVTIRGFRLSGGRAVRGGAVLVEGGADVAFERVSFIGNTATGAGPADGGGALYNAGGTVTVADALFRVNRATEASGGALYNDDGDVTVSDAAFRSNASRRAGGAVEAAGGTTTLAVVTFVGNDARASPGHGGALHVVRAGTVNVDRCTVAGNVAAGQGGGMWNASSGVLLIEHSTVARNRAGEGGGIYNGGGIVNLTYSTLSGNEAVRGGGLVAAAGWAELRNSTVAENTATAEAGGLHTGTGTIIANNSVVGDNAAPTGPDCTGAVVLNVYNVFEDPSDCEVTVSGLGNIGGEEPRLGALAFNGGPTPTHAPQVGSPVIDIGGFCGPTDQTGAPAPAGNACDAGSVEFRGATLARTAGTASLPEAVALYGPSPNPLRTTAAVGYDLPEAAHVRLAVYDALGREVALVVDAEMEAGHHEATLDGAGLPSGAYLLRLEAGAFVRVRPLTRVR
jgi:CSLREA domain-containing protein